MSKYPDNGLDKQVRPLKDAYNIFTGMKDHVKGNCTFQYYRDSSLWYKTEVTELLFPIPISDIGNATFNNKEKGLLMMRYIRKWLDGNKR